MKVLFADSSSLCRYSTILVAQQCVADLSVLEAEALDEANLILSAETVSTVFININILSTQAVDQIQHLRNIQHKTRIILVINTLSEYNAHKHLAMHVDGILQLEDSLENSKAHIAKLLNDNRDSQEDSTQENRFSSSKVFSFSRSEIMLKAYSSIFHLYWCNNIVLQIAD